MRTLHVITDRDRRGAQVHALDLAAGLRSSGVRAEVVALAPGERDDSLVVDTLGPHRTSSTTFRALRRRSRDFDAVIAHGSTTLALCALGLPNGVPFVYRQISDPLFWAGSWSRRLRTGALLRRARCVVALAPEVADTFASHYRLPRSRLVVVPNAVPAHDQAPSDSRQKLRAELGIPPESFVGITLGALVSEKGVDAAVRAIARLPDAHLLIVGDGPERGALSALAEELAPSRVHLQGAVDEPGLMLDAADGILFPSKGGDSMPAALIEAGLRGLPAVATPVGAIEKVVVRGETGLVTPIGDQVAFNSAVERLGTDLILRRSMGRAAREHCQARFTIEAVVPAWIDLLRSVTR